MNLFQQKKKDEKPEDYASTLEAERDKVREERSKAFAEMQDGFSHLFDLMDETLAALGGDPQRIANIRSKDDTKSRDRHE